MPVQVRPSAPTFDLVQSIRDQVCPDFSQHAKNPMIKRRRSAIVTMSFVQARGTLYRTKIRFLAAMYFAH